MLRASKLFARAALSLLIAGGLDVAVLDVVAQAQTQLTPVRFKLDWVWQAPQSIWTLAHERGYFRAEGLDVSIDRGYGGPDTLGSVASGAYDIGFSDVNNLVEFNAKNPDHKLKSAFIVYDATLAAIITRKGNGINTPKDLEGRVIGAPLTTGGRTLFPAFAKANGIDDSKITWETISIQLQDQQFAQGKFDAVASFATTSLLNLKLLGVDLGKLTVFTFFKNGLDLYGSSLLVRPEWAAANPETVRKFLRATMRGMSDARHQDRDRSARYDDRNGAQDAERREERGELRRSRTHGSRPGDCRQGLQRVPGAENVGYLYRCLPAAAAGQNAEVLTDACKYVPDDVIRPGWPGWND